MQMNGAEGITPSNVVGHGLGRDQLAGRVQGPGHREVRKRRARKRGDRSRAARPELRGEWTRTPCTTMLPP